MIASGSVASVKFLGKLILRRSLLPFDICVRTIWAFVRPHAPMTRAMPVTLVVLYLKLFSVLLQTPCSRMELTELP